MNTLQQLILQVLEENDGKCLDTKEGREQVADALVEMMRSFLRYE